MALILSLLGCESEGARDATRGVLGDRCASDEDCRAGYCLEVGGARVCTEPCKRDRDCPSARNWWCAAPREIPTPLCLCRAASRQACGEDLDRDCDGELDPCTSNSEEAVEPEDESSFPVGSFDAGQLPARDAGPAAVIPNHFDAGGLDAGGLDAGRLDGGSQTTSLDASSPLDAARVDAGSSSPVDADTADANDPSAPDASHGFARLEDAVSVALGGPYQSASYEAPTSTLYGAATIFHPTSGRRPFAIAALMPDFIAAQSDMLWWGPVLASHGFVTLVLGTVSPEDVAETRATALEAGLAMLKAENERVGSPVRAELDVSRVGLLGHGMGAGAVLLVQGKGGLSAPSAVLWEPWATGLSFSPPVTPTAILAFNGDLLVTSADQWNLYQSLSSTTSKLYVERTGTDHFAPTAAGTLSEHQAHVAWTVAFLKVYLENDTRYEALLANPGTLVRYGRTR